ncbi:MAG: DNA recombination protein RmuC [Parvularculaceae bacterium]|nr:DNA recombination protein RmuC [Parvularculaceae bacterium]
MQASPGPMLEGNATEAVLTAPAPLITGPVEVLWLLTISVLAIMAIVFALLLRGRAGARRRHMKEQGEFFKPAGDGAEITFDDPKPEALAEPFAERPALAAPKKRGAFEGLFAQKDRKPAIDSGEATEVFENPGEGFASVKIERGPALAEREAADEINTRLEDEIEAERAAQQRAAETELALRQAEERQRAAEADRERRDREMRLNQEEERRRRDAEFWDQRRREEEARRPVAPPQPAFSGAEDYSRTLSDVEEAMTAQREAIQSETRALLDAFAQRLGARLDAIAVAVERTPAANAEAPSAALADIARDVAFVRDRLDRAAAVDPAALQQELALLRQAITGARDTASPSVQLAEVVRNSLSPDAYKMPASLSNSRRADCLVNLPRPSGPIAIDARFPVEAFALLRNADARRAGEAESEFRRIAIRHVVDIAERLISPGETADSAILFLPSEAMYTELHQRFADVVQDAWRARVWIVSPTTLIATLHTIQAALSAAEPRAGGAAFLRDDSQRMTSEMTDLRRRIAALEDLHARAQPQAEPAIPPRAPAPPPRSAYHLSAVGRGVTAPSMPAGDRIGDLEAESAPAGQPTTARPLFPLR